MKHRLGLVLAAGLMTAGFAGTAHADRYVILNGQRLSLAQIMYFDRLSCRRIPNGAYWLNFNTGIWGYARSARPMGHISDGCRSARRGGRRRSLSERGLLYTPPLVVPGGDGSPPGIAGGR